MDFDLEDELAAAAGRGEYVSGGDQTSHKKRAKDPVSSDSDDKSGRRAGPRYAEEEDGGDSQEEDMPPSTGKKGGMPFKKRRVGSKGSKAAGSESEGEEDEGSEDGGGDEEDDEDEFGDGYDAELYKDEEDRQRLAAMTELEREMILAERAEQRDKLKERRLNAMQAQRATGATNAHRQHRPPKPKEPKRPAREEAAASRDDEFEAMYVRSSTRQRGKDNAKDSALQALQKTRESRAQRSGTREEKAKAMQREDRREE
eukprot:CAMPEP_0177598450 /NCGR_PEP_ID=MMETSP0419_2-20121207/12361_1 /TAXON_ID=582737 /ORGANISM="Tetraselmis sp., Strain GSL018" /LENGTH=257 /DNA_ID=CAMNT_0019090907 /DNA_START=147 /DNA_END=917 /DNA_ORIENTATION=+